VSPPRPTGICRPAYLLADVAADAKGKGFTTDSIYCLGRIMVLPKYSRMVSTNRSRRALATAQDRPAGCRSRVHQEALEEIAQKSCEGDSSSIDRVVGLEHRKLEKSAYHDRVRGARSLRGVQGSSAVLAYFVRYSLSLVKSNSELQMRQHRKLRDFTRFSAIATHCNP